MALFPRREFIPAPPLETLLQKPDKQTNSIAYKLEGYDEDVANRPRVLITWLGQEEEAVDALINSTCSIVFSQGQFPIVAATGLSTNFLVQAPMPVEVLPRWSDMSVLDKHEYSYYIERRWKLLLGKWKITETIDLGLEIEDFISAQIEQKLHENIE